MTPAPAALTPWERAVGGALRLWPFLSGLGKLASSAPARRLVPPSPRVVWAPVRAARCAAPLDDLVGRAIALAGDLDPKVTWAVDRLAAPGDTVLDVGANLGLVSLLAAQRVGPKGRVLAFEPSPVVLPHLRATLAANPALPIRLHEVALGEEPGTLALRVPEGNAGGGSLVAHPDLAGHAVPVRPLADVLSEEGVADVALMKLDVEGYEAPVLRGLLRPGAPRPRAVLFEENGATASPVAALLRAEGYRLWGLPRALLRLMPVPDGAPGFARCNDIVALRADRPDLPPRLGLT